MARDTRDDVHIDDNFDCGDGYASVDVCQVVFR